MSRLVVVAAPWTGLGAGERAIVYLRNCIRDVLADGDIPWASHAMLSLTGALYDHDAEQRAEGLDVNKRMIQRADLVAFYIDHGKSQGMEKALAWAKIFGKKIENRYLYQVRALPAKAIRSY